MLDTTGITCTVGTAGTPGTAGTAGTALIVGADCSMFNSDPWHENMFMFMYMFMHPSYF